MVWYRYRYRSERHDKRLVPTPPKLGVEGHEPVPQPQATGRGGIALHAACMQLGACFDMLPRTPSALRLGRPRPPSATPPVCCLVLAVLQASPSPPPSRVRPKLPVGTCTATDWAARGQATGPQQARGEVGAGGQRCETAAAASPAWQHVAPAWQHVAPAWQACGRRSCLTGRRPPRTIIPSYARF